MKIISILFCLNIYLISNVEAGIHQKKLLLSLFRNYDRHERPVKNENESLNVSINLSLQQIVDVDEKKQTIIFNGWLDMSWMDYNLVWNPDDFGNITLIRVSSSRIWVPADDSFDTTSKVNAVISSNGLVSYLPPGIFRSTCAIKVDDFPFDTQVCKLKFGSWTYDESTVNLTNKSDKAQNDSYIKNGEWLLEKSISYDCCPEKFPFVMFEIHLRRRTLYFVFNLIFPCILISFMTLLGFILPPDSGEKIALEVTVLLSIILYSQIINQIIPESSLSIPKIAIYFTSVMVISSSSIIASILVLLLHHRNVKIQQPMPKWIKVYICGYLAKFLNMKQYDKRNKQIKSLNLSLSYQPLSGRLNSFSDLREVNFANLASSLKNNNKTTNDNDTKLSIPFERLKNSKKTNASRKLSNLTCGNVESNQSNLDNINCLLINKSSITSNKLDIYLLRQSIHLLLRELRMLTNKMRRDEEDERKALLWKFTAMVIDRLCLIIFTIATLSSTAILFIGNPNILRTSDPDPIY